MNDQTANNKPTTTDRSKRTRSNAATWSWFSCYLCWCLCVAEISHILSEFRVDGETSAREGITNVFTYRSFERPTFPDCLTFVEICRSSRSSSEKPIQFYILVQGKFSLIVQKSTLFNHHNSTHAVSKRWNTLVGHFCAKCSYSQL